MEAQVRVIHKAHQCVAVGMTSVLLLVNDELPHQLRLAQASPRHLRLDDDAFWLQEQVGPRLHSAIARVPFLPTDVGKVQAEDATEKILHIVFVGDLVRSLVVPLPKLHDEERELPAEPDDELGRPGWVDVEIAHRCNHRAAERDRENALLSEPIKGLIAMNGGGLGDTLGWPGR
jgi:hypothetical protein